MPPHHAAAGESVYAFVNEKNRLDSEHCSAIAVPFNVANHAEPHFAAIAWICLLAGLLVERFGNLPAELARPLNLDGLLFELLDPDAVHRGHGAIEHLHAGHFALVA